MSSNEETRGPEAVAPAQTAGAKTTPLTGARLKDRYVIEKEIGRGGFGAVYLARDEQLHGRPVVIKVLLEQASDSEWYTKKFRQESEALARIDHPGVVGVLDAGQMPDGKPFLVMQFVDGVTLRAVMKAGRLELGRAARLVRQLGGALTAAHERGVYHRDLKPENIMLQDLGGGEEQAKIIDFGIATVMESQAARPEATRVAGSAHYMAPEQLLGKPAASSDIYSLGVIAYEMVTGWRPFEPESGAQLYLLQQEGVKTKPAELRPELSGAAQEAILKAMSFDAGLRYARARDFGEEFARAAGGDTGAAKTAAARPTAVGAKAGTGPSLEMGHVLFMDVVGYSLLPTDRQTEVIEQLQQIVRGTAEFERAHAAGGLVGLPTGDGMALVFFRDPAAPVECAVAVAKALRGAPEIRLRMGVHTGPVYRVADINANRNVAGGGINLAQRVMDCGDAGHILLSRSIAEVIGQLSGWSKYLQDLGEHEVKHGVRVQLFNLSTGDVGNPAVPKKLRAEAGRSRARKAGAAAGVAVVGIAIAAGLWVWRRPGPPVADREFHYSITVQKLRGGKPQGAPFVLPGEIIFEDGYQIRLAAGSSQAGFLYVFNEGPVAAGGLPGYNVMFPGAEGTAALAPGQKILIPEVPDWIVFDKEEGTEKLWMVWSAEALPELEAMRRFAVAEHQGVVRDPAVLRGIQGALEKAGASPPQVEREEARRQTTVRGRGVVARLVRLEHH